MERLEICTTDHSLEIMEPSTGPGALLSTHCWRPRYLSYFHAKLLEIPYAVYILCGYILLKRLSHSRVAQYHIGMKFASIGLYLHNKHSNDSYWVRCFAATKLYVQMTDICFK